MLALKGATAAFALDCHGKKKNAISLQQQPGEGQQLSREPLVHPVALAFHANTRYGCSGVTRNSSHSDGRVPM